MPSSWLLCLSSPRLIALSFLHASSHNNISIIDVPSNHKDKLLVPSYLSCCALRRDIATANEIMMRKANLLISMVINTPYPQVEWWLYFFLRTYPSIRYLSVILSMTCHPDIINLLLYNSSSQFWRTSLCLSDKRQSIWRRCGGYSLIGRTSFSEDGHRRRRGRAWF